MALHQERPCEGTGCGQGLGEGGGSLAECDAGGRLVG